MSSTSARVVVAGIGNAYRQDDGAGVAVAAEIASSFPGIFDIGPIAEPLDLLGKWDLAELAVVIDATRSGTAPGSITVIDLDEEGAPSLVGASQHTSTHGLGIPDVLRLARVVHAAPRRVVLVGVEGLNFGDGATMSAPVISAIPLAIDLVSQLVAEQGYV